MALLLPTLAVKHVTDITPEMLHAMQVKGMILDVDNTLSRHGCPIPFAGSVEWTHQMRKAGIAVIIVSNNFKRRVSEFAAKYDLPYLYRAFKPLPKGYRQAMRYLNLPANQIVVVGDQIFTDILGANAIGMKSILLTPRDMEHSLTFRVRRKIEAPIRKRIFKKGIYQSTRSDDISPHQSSNQERE